MIIFGALFGRVTGMKGDGSPYPLFVFAGLVPWTFFANALGLAANSLVGSEQMIRKTYFPRILIPIGMICALGLDMLISLGFMGVLMAYYHWHLTAAVVLVPALILGTLLSTAGLASFFLRSMSSIATLSTSSLFSPRWRFFSPRSYIRRATRRPSRADLIEGQKLG